MRSSPVPALSNPRWEVFAIELSHGQTAMEAHRRAGYSADRGTASKLQREPRIVQRVRELLEDRASRDAKASEVAVERLALSKEWVLDKLRENALISLGEKTIKMKVRPRGKDFSIDVEVTARDAAAANRALELIGKELGMFIERSANLNFDLEALPDDQRRAAIEWLTGRLSHMEQQS